MTVSALAQLAQGTPLVPVDLAAFGPLGATEVEIAVDHCSVCHSDVHLLDGDWGDVARPLVPGHEVIGRISALGENAKGLSLGQRVGVGWAASSCMHCLPCLNGEQNLCAQNVGTIVGRHGGFADKVRVQWPWAIPVPDGVDARGRDVFAKR